MIHHFLSQDQMICHPYFGCDSKYAMYLVEKLYLYPHIKYICIQVVFEEKTIFESHREQIYFLCQFGPERYMIFTFCNN